MNDIKQSAVTMNSEEWEIFLKRLEGMGCEEEPLGFARTQRIFGPIRRGGAFNWFYEWQKLDAEIDLLFLSHDDNYEDLKHFAVWWNQEQKNQGKK
jgi:hypothetical protein